VGAHRPSFKKKRNGPPTSSHCQAGNIKSRSLRHGRPSSDWREFRRETRWTRHSKRMQGRMRSSSWVIIFQKAPAISRTPCAETVEFGAACSTSGADVERSLFCSGTIFSRRSEFPPGVNPVQLRFVCAVLSTFAAQAHAGCCLIDASIQWEGSRKLDRLVALARAALQVRDWVCSQTVVSHRRSSCYQYSSDSEEGFTLGTRRAESQSWGTAFSVLFTR
jgi:hypothetical protein